MFKVVSSLLQGFFSTHSTVKWLIVLVVGLIAYILIAGLSKQSIQKDKAALEEQLAVKQIQVETLVNVQKDTVETLEKQEKANEAVAMITTQEQHDMFLQSKALEEINRSRETQIKAIEKQHRVINSPKPQRHGIVKPKHTNTVTHHSQSKKKAISRVQIATLWSTYCLYNSNPSCHG